MESNKEPQAQDHLPHLFHQVGDKVYYITWDCSQRIKRGTIIELIQECLIVLDNGDQVPIEPVCVSLEEAQNKLIKILTADINYCKGRIERLRRELEIKEKRLARLIKRRARNLD